MRPFRHEPRRHRANIPRIRFEPNACQAFKGQLQRKIALTVKLGWSNTAQHASPVSALCNMTKKIIKFCLTLCCFFP